MSLNNSGTMVGRERVWPQHLCFPAVLDSNRLDLEPAGDIAKDRVASTIWDVPKRLRDPLPPRMGSLCYAGGPETDSQNLGHDLLRRPAGLESLGLDAAANECKGGLAITLI